MSTSKLEDQLGGVALAMIFSFMAYREAVEIADSWAGVSLIGTLAIAGKVACLAFLGLVLALTIVRHDVKSVAAGLEPRLTAIGGTFCLLLLIGFPKGSPPAAIGVLSNILIVVGASLSFWCAMRLGRSFAVAAAARQLVVSGPYAHVRHPLYAAEALTAVGVVLAHWSPAALAMLIVWGVLQYRRAGNEEKVLAAAFPDYAVYAAKVPRLIPSLRAYEAERESPRGSRA
ncbi:methyltransferase family protein [Aminobacter sp. MET-1]|uniref:methyltransferase family protein n=1 Tax=Aminobacter sp. MET-1 TaxID=2951085 RepID=UPI00226A8CAD|nr:isoprenylcysteine carboxylmethyltransferase family protein [Aminobacter sp. MET-1]MCX8571101.1 isoprenylcysteine carboxylmethyltransferase family protein [Aminobacter sp. MET-1]MCX8573230.1 isoprenylcysteine carboxylmethyltransferase family protein [Aminobacter sp. MET-1]